MVHRYVLGQVDVVKRWEPLAQEGSDPEGVHKMRVAIRRTRTIVRTYREVLPGDKAERFTAELRWIARQLGHARDSDICTESFDQYGARLQLETTVGIESLASYIGARRAEAYEGLRAALSGERYTLLIDQLRDIAVSHAAVENQNSPPPAVADGLTAATATVTEHGNRITKNSTAAELHSLRIKVKRLRYLLDFLATHNPLDSTQLAASTREIQELLGQHQDAITVQEVLADYEVSDKAREAPAAESRLIEAFRKRLAARTIECRRRFPEIWTRWTFC